MRKNLNNETFEATGVTSKSALTHETLQSENQVSLISHSSYHELADRTLVQSDSLNQLHANLNQLADLQARLGFVMREVRYLLKAY